LTRAPTHTRRLPRPSPRLPSLSPPPLLLRRTAINEYQLCVEKRGKGDLLCAQRGRDYATVCPQKWIDDL
jgi:hypothetical protein